MENDNIFNDLDESEKRFALHVVTHPEDSAAEAARQAGAPDHSARQRAYELNQRPAVQQAIQALKEKIGSMDKIDVEELVNHSLVDILTNEETHARDKLNAAQLLGKTKAMFTDKVEQTTKDMTDEELLNEIEKVYGKEARNKAAKDLGLE